MASTQVGACGGDQKSDAVRFLGLAGQGGLGGLGVVPEDTGGGEQQVSVVFRCRGSSGSSDPCRYAVTHIHRSTDPQPARGPRSEKMDVYGVSAEDLSESEKTKIKLELGD